MDGQSKRTAMLAPTQVAQNTQGLGQASQDLWLILVVHVWVDIGMLYWLQLAAAYLNVYGPLPVTDSESESHSPMQGAGFPNSIP